MKEHPAHKGYFVTEDGRVYTSWTKQGIGCKLRELSKHIDEKGYCQVRLKGVRKRVHRLVAETFIPNPNNLPCINHKNEVKNDNRIENLEWCSISYNNSYSHSKVHRLETPTGEIVEVYNLKQYCRDNNLNDSHLYNKERKNKSKGFTLLETAQN